jgi:predicted ATPase
MAGMLDAIGTPGRPALLILDDAQWADDLSVRLIADWSRGRGEGAGTILVVTSFRSEEVGAGHPLRAIESLDHVVLAPLGADEIGSLATTMAGALPPAALAAVGRLSGGNPFMATAALRGLVESAAIERHSEGLRLAEGAFDDVGSSSAAADLLVRGWTCCRSPPSRS